MKRVKKDPEVRREELMDVAEELFLINGYDETPVSDIVKKAQVGQGTFYYYFKSKDEILDALADRYLEGFIASVEKLVKREDLNAAGKITAFFMGSSELGLSRKKLVTYLHEEKNALLHLKIEQKGYPLIAPFFEKIIKQGVNEGLFDNEYPYETALLVLTLMDTLFNAKQFFEKTAQEQKKTVAAAFYLMEKVLGAERGSLVKPFLNMEGIYGK